LKLPTLQQATDAIDALGRLTGHSAEVNAANSLVAIVVDLFDGQPREQAQLQATYAAAKERTDASLARLDTAIADRLAGR